MGKDRHLHHAPLIASAANHLASSNNAQLTHGPLEGEATLASDDDESACRGYPALRKNNNNDTPHSGHANDDAHAPTTAATSMPIAPIDAGTIMHTAEEQATAPKINRVASPVLSKDFALLDKHPSNASSSAASSDNAAPRPSILRNSHEDGNAKSPRGRDAASLSTTAVGDNGTATSPSRVNFSPLANPRINKALKSLVRSSSEPGMSRSKASPRNGTASAIAGVGAQLGVLGAGSPLTPVQSENEKTSVTIAEEDEKAGLQGSKVFTVGGEHGQSTGHAHHHHHHNGHTNEKRNLLTVGNLPLARSSEPYLPTSRGGNGIFDDPEDAPHNHHQAYPPPIGGSAPGIAGATGGAGAPTLTFEGLLEPEKPLKPPPTWKTSMWNIIKYSWLNVLLVFIPVSFACHFSDINDTATFCVSFAAIIPLAALLGFATEELALRVGHTLGGLLNATFGNTVELIIAILALVKGELRVVQAAMIGSILSNCLLVLGCCFFAGGIRFHEQVYTIRSAQLNISLLGISALVIVIPAAFNAAVTQLGSVPVAISDRDILKLSRGVAFILLFLYAAYLFFQFWTHSYLYRAANTQHHRSLRARSIVGDDEPQPPMDTTVLRIPSWHSSSSSDDSSSTHSREQRDRDVEAEAESPAATAGSSTVGGGGGSSPGTNESEDRRLGHKAGTASVSMARTTTNGTTHTSTSTTTSSASSDSDDEEHETPKLKVQAAIVLILVVTAITGVTAEWLVDSIDGVTESGNISREFVALILLPLVGNVAEHVTAVTVSVKDKLDLSMAVAVGSSIQISLFVIPILVLLGWCIGQPLTLEFDVLETIILFVSIIIVNQAISDGKTNWMEGAVLISTYVTIALAMWFYPGGGGL